MSGELYRVSGEFGGINAPLCGSSVGGDVVTVDHVRKIASLVKLRFSDVELAAYAGNLASVVGWVRCLTSVDTSSVGPTCHGFGVESSLLALEIDDVCSQDESGQEDAYVDRRQMPVPDGTKSFCGYFAVPDAIKSE